MGHGLILFWIRLFFCNYIVSIREFQATFIPELTGHEWSTSIHVNNSQYEMQWMREPVRTVMASLRRLHFLVENRFVGYRDPPHTHTSTRPLQSCLPDVESVLIPRQTDHKYTESWHQRRHKDRSQIRSLQSCHHCWIDRLLPHQQNHSHRHHDWRLLILQRRSVSSQCEKSKGHRVRLDLYAQSKPHYRRSCIASIFTIFHLFSRQLPTHCCYWKETEIQRDL